MSHVSTHVLDTSLGVPAAGVHLALTDADGVVIASGVTDDDGRVADLGPEALHPGTHTLTFATGAYFAVRGVASFFPSVAVSFTIPEGPATHHHVPLLLSPFAYSTYRGS